MDEFIKKLINRLLLESSGCRVYKLINPNIEDITEFNAYKKCIEIINELAEEYNDDFCEWRKRKKGLYLHGTSCGAQDSYDDSYRYCPYCGKKVKVINNE